MRRVEIAALLVLILLLVGLPTATFAYEGALEHSHGVREITLVAVDGHWTPGEIHVRQGEHIRLRITSHDVVHGFVLGEYGLASTNIYPGKFTIADFVASKPGRFSFACVIWCNVNHPNMQGTLVVDPA